MPSQPLNGRLSAESIGVHFEEGLVVLDDDCLTDRRRQEVHVEEQGLCDALRMYLHPCIVRTIIIIIIIIVEE